MHSKRSRGARVECTKLLKPGANVFYPLQYLALNVAFVLQLPCAVCFLFVILCLRSMAAMSRSPSALKVLKVLVLTLVLTLVAVGIPIGVFGLLVKLFSHA
ncbi:hypothetical protein QFZ96_007882 [Paraburkholderia youngii]|uniref:Uncharacterized protein n=1 Tax=Paraburkholderia youngii TaxID=2782701 RepID=A0A7W8L9N8_9BURK|nr:hypothetical protein [Paraburkholderia youngii]